MIETAPAPRRQFKLTQVTDQAQAASTAQANPR